MRHALLVVSLLACGQREPPPRVDPPLAPSVAAPQIADAAATWSGDPIEARVVEPESATFELGNDIATVVRTPSGWLAVRVREDGGQIVEDVIDKRGVIATARSLQLVGGAPRAFVVEYDTDRRPSVSRVDGRKLVKLAGAIDLRWVFDGVGIANDTSRGLKTQRWQTIAVERDTLRVVETSQGERYPYATGATLLDDHVIVATREHDPPASDAEKAAALVEADRGNTGAFARIVGQPRGWLLRVDKTAKVVESELFAQQPPNQVAATASGWLVVATEGTAARMYKDGILLARAPNDASLRVLGRDLELVSQLIAAGDWACLYTMPGDNRVIHCVDPVRRLHVKSPPLADNVTLYGIELAPKPRLVFQHRHYRDGYGKPVVEETLALALP